MDNFENGQKTKKSGGLLVVILLVIIIIVAGAGYYFLKINKPKHVFEQQINALLSSDTEISKYKTAKVTTNLTAKVNSDEEEVKQVADLINDAKLTILSEMDIENKEGVIGVKLTKAKDDLVDAKMKIEEESQNMYIDLGDFFEKTIKLDVSEVLDDEIEISDTSISSFGKMVNTLKAEQIAKDTIKSQLKEEYFSAENATIDGNKFTKNELKLSEEEFITILKNIFDDLADNEEFLNCYEDKDDIKETLKNAAESLEDVDVNKKAYITIDIYTSGIMKKAERVDFIIDDGSDKLALQITKKADGQYAYKFGDDEVSIDGELKINLGKNDYEFELSMKYEEIEFIFNLNGNVVYDEELDSIKTKDAVDINDLSMEDINKIISNFSKSKLYEIVEGISGSYESSSDLKFDLEDDNQEDDDSSNEKSDKEKEEKQETKKNSSSADNIVKTYDGDEIKFSIPDDFEIYSSESDTYKLFEKRTDNGDIDVDVTVSYSTMDGYKKSIESKAKRYEEDEKYSNVELSDPETVEVNGNKFTKQTLKYDYNGYTTVTYNNEYYSYEIDSEYIYTVEIEGADLISDKEINTFLTIEK